MKKTIALLSLVAAALIAMPAISSAQDTAAAPAAAAGAAKKKGQSFHGKVVSVDATANTITVGKQTLTVTSTTKITKDGKPATLGDFAAGDAVAGACKMDGDKLTATTLHTAAPKKKKAE